MKSYILIGAVLFAAFPACAVSEGPAIAQADANDAGDEGRPSCDDAPLLKERFLEAVNRVRSSARSCGDERFEATSPLNWDQRLHVAASAHSRDMAENDFFSHSGSNGRAAGHRATEAGYPWRRVGENLAAGQGSVAAVIDGWLDSPEHCANLMDPRFTELGAACVADDDGDYGTFWTLVLGRPR